MYLMLTPGYDILRLTDGVSGAADLAFRFGLAPADADAGLPAGQEVGVAGDGDGWLGGGGAVPQVEVDGGGGAADHAGGGGWGGLGGVFAVLASRLHAAVAGVDEPLIARVGGCHVEPAAIDAGGGLVFTAPPEAHDEFVDAVGGEVGRVLGHHAGRALRVGTVDGGLVRLAAGPERQRGRRGHERGAV